MDCKLKFWSAQHLSLASRVVIVNSVLLSTLWFFVSIWGGSLTVLRKIRSTLANYLWSGTPVRAPARVPWADCTLPKTAGGLGLIDPEIGLTALLGKWIIHAFESGETNLQQLLQHRLTSITPTRGGGRWMPSLHWPMIHQFLDPKGSPIWNKILHAWRRLVRESHIRPPSNTHEVLSTSLLWASHYLGGNFGFAKDVAQHLAKQGLQ